MSAIVGASGRRQVSVLKLTVALSFVIDLLAALLLAALDKIIGPWWWGAPATVPTVEAAWHAIGAGPKHIERALRGRGSAPPQASVA